MLGCGWVVVIADGVGLSCKETHSLVGDGRSSVLVPVAPLEVVRVNLS